MKSKDIPPLIITQAYVEEPTRQAMNDEEAEQVLFREIARLQKANQLVVEKNGTLVTFRRPDGTVLLAEDTKAIDQVDEKLARFLRRFHDPDLAGAPHVDLLNIGKTPARHSSGSSPSGKDEERK